MASYRKRNRKIAKYRRPLNINIGIIIFVAIFIYIVVSVIVFLTTPHVSAYEVRQGQITKDYTYTGIAVREEQVVYAQNSGYISYYAMERDRVANGTQVYLVDETGSVYDAVKESTSAKEELSADDLKDVQSTIENFIRTFDTSSFDSAYTFKNSLDNKLLDLLSVNLASSLEQILTESGASASLNIASADQPGILLFYIDGYENLTVDAVTSETFKQDEYVRTVLHSNTLVAAGDPAYKLVTDEEWSVVIEVDEETALELENRSTSNINVVFTKDKSSARASYTITARDNSYFAELHFYNSMVRFAEDRFVELELQIDTTVGLKIPQTAVIEKDFFIVPEEYITTGGNSNASGVILEKVDDDGNTITQFTEVSIYRTEADINGENPECYVESDGLAEGAVLIKSDSNDRYNVMRKGQLKGVYNINKGYAVFRQVDIKYESSDYCIVAEGTAYGLAIYDHIVLDGTTVEENDVVY